MGCMTSQNKIRIDEKEIVSIHSLRIINKRSIIKDNIKNNLFLSLRSWSLPIDFSRESISNIYDLNKNLLGKGNFGKIFKGKLKLDNTKKFAIKKINKKYIKENNLYINELNILRNLDHPNIIKFYETYYEKNNYYIVMELCKGGDLNSYFNNNKKFLKENDVKSIMFQIFYTLNYLHSNEITHRDIKLENFLLKENNNFNIKLIDFGFSKNTLKNMKNIFGTPYYLAPEILKGDYDFQVDNWSAGVIMYYLLCGEMPFKGYNKRNLFHNIFKMNYSFKNSIWKSISNEAISILKRIFVNPNDRLKSTQALEDEWFQKFIFDRLNLGKKQLSDEVINRLLNYKKKNKFKLKICKLIISFFFNDNIKIKNLENAFFYLDYSNTGFIQKKELEIFFKEFGYNVTLNKIDKIIENFCLQNSNYISYTEFIAGCIDEKLILTDSKLSIIFKNLDLDSNNFLTLKNLIIYFKRFGFYIEKDDLKKILNEIDILKGEKISYNEFIKKMKM